MTNESFFGVSLLGPFIIFHKTFFFRFNDLGRISLKIENVVSNTTGFLFQSQDFNDTNSKLNECVAGSRTLAMVRVEVYAVSIIGSFRLSIRGFSKPFFYPGKIVSGSGTIDSGEYIHAKPVI